MLTDHDIVIGGLDIRKPSVEHVYALMRVLHTRVIECMDVASATPLMDFFYLNLSQTLSVIDTSRFACGIGCSHCCTSWVAASAPEVLYLLRHLPQDQSRDVRKRLSETMLVTEGLGAEERQRIKTPCPMLHDNMCSIYAVRPLVCRTLVSYDRTACERIYNYFTGERVPVSQAYDVLRNVYALALAGALRRAGLPHYFYEFNSALSRLIELEDAEEVWLSGADILDGLPLDRGGDMFSDAWNRQVYEEAFK